MARYKVMGMKKGDLVVVGTFANKRDAEGFIRMTQRSAKVGSLSVEDSYERKSEALPKAAAMAAAGAGPVESFQFVAQIDSTKRNPMPFAVIIAIAAALMVGSIFLIEGINSMLSTLR